MGKRKSRRKQRKADPPGRNMGVWLPYWLFVGLLAEANVKEHSLSRLVTEALIDYFGLHREHAAAHHAPRHRHR